MTRTQFLRYGRLCECYFGLGMQINDIAKEANCPPLTVSHAISHYFAKPEQSVVIESKMDCMPLKRIIVRERVFDNQTGVYYNNCLDAAIATNKPHRTICNWVKGVRKQKEVRFIKA